MPGIRRGTEDPAVRQTAPPLLMEWGKADNKQESKQKIPAVEGVKKAINRMEGELSLKPCSQEISHRRGDKSM